MALAAALLVTLLLAGCGGGDETRKPGTARQPEASAEQGRGPEVQAERGGETESEGEEREKGLSSIPRTDRLAFVQIGVAAGDLDASASILVVRNLNRRRDTLTLKRLRPRVRALRPEDAQLRQLRRQVLAALDQAIRARRHSRSARSSGWRTLEVASRIVRDLKAYEASHPSITALVPD